MFSRKKCAPTFWERIERVADILETIPFSFIHEGRGNRDHFWKIISIHFESKVAAPVFVVVIIIIFGAIFCC